MELRKVQAQVFQRQTVKGGLILENLGLDTRGAVLNDDRLLSERVLMCAEDPRRLAVSPAWLPRHLRSLAEWRNMVA